MLTRIGVGMAVFGVFVWTKKRMFSTFEAVNGNPDFEDFTHQLITEELDPWFGYARNPYYVLDCIWFAGFAIMFNSKWQLAVMPLHYLFLHFHTIPAEEARLTDAFGQEYIDYCARVRRWGLF